MKLVRAVIALAGSGEEGFHIGFDDNSIVQNGINRLELKEHRKMKPATVTRRMLTIVNPRGGSRRGASLFASVRSVLESGGYDLNIQETESAGHATEIVRDATPSSFDAICVVGGDGTVHEVVQGLMTHRPENRVPVALIPAGTGNTLHQELGCNDPIAAAEFAVSGQAQSIDVARVSTNTGIHYCVNIVGFGAVVDINRTAERMRWIGRARYPIAALRHILFPAPRQVRLTLDDDGVHGEFLFVLACNTKSTGTNMKLAPEARLDDGLIDVVLLRNASRFQIFTVFLKSFNGSHLSLPCVECHQVRSFTLSSDFPEGLNLDGELTGTSPLSVEIESNAIKVFGDRH